MVGSGPALTHALPLSLPLPKAIQLLLLSLLKEDGLGSIGKGSLDFFLILKGIFKKDWLATKMWSFL